MVTEAVSSSFRDPAGFVLLEDNKALRFLSEAGTANFLKAEKTGLIEDLIKKQFLLPTEKTNLLPQDYNAEDSVSVLSQPRLPFISYPYEWCFDALKDAALLHLDVQLLALKYGFELSDATAFNIQFEGYRPYFIDIGSFVPRKAGGYWRGYRQFCEQFLNPLLLQCEVGIPFNALYRGYTRGIPTTYLAPMLRFSKRIKPRNYLHVVLHAKMIEKNSTSGSSSKNIHLSDEQHEYFLTSLRRWISSLEVPNISTAWSNYTKTRTYEVSEISEKIRFIEDWTRQWKPDFVLDLGANTGEASRVAAKNGAKTVVSVELDETSTNLSYKISKDEQLPVLPLIMNLTNMTPSQGWQNKEWENFQSRSKADVVYSLALLHHLVISEGIPLNKAIPQICSFGKHGIIEFIPPDDPMVVSLRARVENHDMKYSEEHFLYELKKCATVISDKIVTKNGRHLYAYETK